MFPDAALPKIRQRSWLAGSAAALLVLSACSGDDSSTLELPTDPAPTTTLDNSVAPPSLAPDPDLDSSSTTTENSATSQPDHVAATTDVADLDDAVTTTELPVDTTRPPTTIAPAPTTTDDVLDEDVEFRRAAAKSPQQVLIYFGTDIETAEATYGDLFDEISRRIVAVERSREVEELAELLAPETYSGVLYDVATGKLVVSVTTNVSNLDELTEPEWEPYVTVKLAG